ncbi:MAG: co-chaperone GroES [Armatimonadota bacterium]
MYTRKQDFHEAEVFRVLKPLSDRIVVKASAKEEVTKGGIVLPDTAKEKPQEGEVIAVGPGKVLDNGKTVPMEVKVGDVVLYAKYGGTEVKVDGEEYIILRQDDVLAIK